MLPSATRIEEAGIYLDPVTKELSLSPPKTSSIEAAVTEDTLYRDKRDKAEWVAKWQKLYGEWSEVMNKIIMAYGLKREDGRPVNALKLCREWERLHLYGQNPDQANFELLEKMRAIVREAEWLQKKGAFGQDTDYMQRRGYSEAFNMATFGMCLDAVNAKKNKGLKGFVIDNFGAVFIMLAHVKDLGHTDLMRQYADNKDAFPEKDANAILEGTVAFLEKVTNKEVSQDILPDVLRPLVGSVMDMVLDSTPKWCS